MCGIAGIVGATATRLAAAEREQGPRPDEAAGPRCLRRMARRERLARLSPPVDHRPVAGGHQPMSADERRLDRLQRRDLQLPRPPRRAGGARHPLPDALRHRGAARAYAEWGGGLDALDGMFAFAIWDDRDRRSYRPRPLRREAALLRQRPGRLLRVRLRPQGGPRAGRPGAADRRRSARRRPRLRLPARIEHGLQWRAHAAAGQLPADRPHGTAPRRGGLLEVAAGRAPRSGRYEDYLQELEASLRTVVRRRLIDAIARWACC